MFAIEDKLFLPHKSNRWDFLDSILTHNTQPYQYE